MSSSHLLDPELLPLVEAFNDFHLSSETLGATRKASAERVMVGDPASSETSRETVLVSGTANDQPDVRCLLYRPSRKRLESAAYLHIHGGGYVLGSPEMSDVDNIRLAAELGITILSVDYRLAPEHPAPFGLQDCFAALAWLHENSERLGIDRSRIAVGGESAGAGLACALSLYAEQASAYEICFQSLTYPMLDDRTGRDAESTDPLCGEFVWTPESNRFAWSAYLGDQMPSAPVVPARSTQLNAQPDTWICSGTLDLFRDENIAFAQRLMEAGVSTELVVYPGACHAFQRVAESSLSKQYYRDHQDALRRGLRCIR